MNTKSKANVRTEPHKAWLRFFTYAQKMKDGVIARLVIQDQVPIFMEHSYDDINLSENGFRPWASVSDNPPPRIDEYSPEWSKLLLIAAELGYCEFLDLKIVNGVPVKIGKVVNKEKLV